MHLIFSSVSFWFLLHFFLMQFVVIFLVDIMGIIINTLNLWININLAFKAHINSGPIHFSTLPYAIDTNYIFVYCMPINIDLYLYYCHKHLSFKLYRKKRGIINQNTIKLLSCSYLHSDRTVPVGLPLIFLTGQV